MADFDEYRDQFEKDYFNPIFSGFLLTPGTSLYHEKKLLWDILNNTRELWIANIWSVLDIDFLIRDYTAWIKADNDRVSDYLNDDYSHDIDYPYYQQILNLCSIYTISKVHEVGELSLLHMLRLLVFKLKSKFFDGSKKRILDLYSQINFGDGFSFATVTETNGLANASAKYYLLSAFGNNPNIVEFNVVDKELFENGFYNIIVLGIKYTYTITTFDALIYDQSDYDDGKKYDGGMV